MYSRFKSDFFCFIHIEKCAGTTFSHSLKYNIPTYLSLRPWYYWTNETGNYLGASELKWIRRFYPILKGIGGHTTRTFLDYESVLDKRIKYFSFVRNPIDRYMSHFNHQVNKMGKDWTIESFIEESRFNNYITKRIAGEENLELAKLVIERDYTFIGLFEEFDKSLILLNRFVFSDKLNLNYEYKNDSRNERKVSYSELDDVLQKKIIDNNRLDIELYNFIKHFIYPKFESSFDGNLEDVLLDFQEKNKDFKYKRVIYYIINSTRILTEKIIEPLAHILNKIL